MEQFEIGDRVFHISGFVQRRWSAGTVIGTAHSHPWDCCPGMVLVQPDQPDIRCGATDVNAITVPLQLLQPLERYKDL